MHPHAEKGFMEFFDEVDYMKLVLRRYTEQTEKENLMHQRHVSGWLNGNKPHSECPCIYCYQQRRERLRL